MKLKYIQNEGNGGAMSLQIHLNLITEQTPSPRIICNILYYSSSNFRMYLIMSYWTSFVIIIIINNLNRNRFQPKRGSVFIY